MDKLLLVGGGGYCKSVLDCLDRTKFSQIAICDAARRPGEHIMGVPVIGCDADLPDLYREGFRKAVIAIGSIGNAKPRLEMLRTLKTIGFSLPVIVDSSAFISDYATVGEGTFIGKHVLISAGSVIGRCCILDSGSIVEHDCRIGDFGHIAPGVVFSGSVCVGAHTFVGANSVIIQQKTVGEAAFIGAGSVVVSDIPDHVIAYGNPCRVQKEG